MGKTLTGFFLALGLCCFAAPEGMNYLHLTSAAPQSIHIIEVNPQESAIVLVKALDQCIGKESVLFGVDIPMEDHDKAIFLRDIKFSIVGQRK